MFLSLELRYTLNYFSESIATFSKLSIYGQGQRHRSNKSAQNVSFFSYLRLRVFACPIGISVNPTGARKCRLTEGCKTTLVQDVSMTMLPFLHHV